MSEADVALLVVLVACAMSLGWAIFAHMQAVRTEQRILGEAMMAAAKRERERRQAIWRAQRK